RRSNIGSGPCTSTRAGSSSADALARFAGFVTFARFATPPSSSLLVSCAFQSIGLAEHLPVGVCRRKVHMACRIDRVVTEDGVAVIKISGRLAAHDVEMLRTLLEP